MDTTIHTLDSLFTQLGLDSSPRAIEEFTEKNRALPGEIELCDAPFWSVSQASFLKQAKDDDSDWASIVDQLNSMLR